MIKCRKVKIAHNKSHGASDKYRKPEYPKMPCNFDIGVAECFENAKLLSVCAYIVFNIEKQHNNRGRNQAAARNGGDHPAHKHLKALLGNGFLDPVGGIENLLVLCVFQPGHEQKLPGCGHLHLNVVQGDASLAGAVYGIYKGEELIDTYTTDENGQFTTDYYICDDDWTVREISPSEGYLLDTAIHHIGAEPELYTVERNSTANDVNEQIIKGNIAIIKHTDDGETQIETPETGATFEVYLKAAGSYDAAKETERDILTCDENGFAQTKDMPYGVYVVEQTSGWEGRELMKPFEVFISKDGQTYRYLINNANFESYIKIVKKDAETGATIPYAGAGFQIYDPNGELVTMTFTYPEVTTIDTFYTTADGDLITPQTLEYGTGYSIVEVQAPYDC